VRLDDNLLVGRSGDGQVDDAQPGHVDRLHQGKTRGGDGKHCIHQDLHTLLYFLAM
jgi:hypothetical protein